MKHTRINMKLLCFISLVGRSYFCKDRAIKERLWYLKYRLSPYNVSFSPSLLLILCNNMSYCMPVFLAGMAKV